MTLAENRRQLSSGSRNSYINMATTQRYIDLRPAMLKAAVELV